MFFGRSRYFSIYAKRIPSYLYPTWNACANLVLCQMSQCIRETNRKSILAVLEYRISAFLALGLGYKSAIEATLPAIPAIKRGWALFFAGNRGALL